MSVMHSQESKYSIESRKYEAQFTQFGAPGRPHVYRDYPTMMYKAGRNPQGMMIEILPGTDGRAEASNEAERANLESLGYVWGGAKAAVDAFERRLLDDAAIAAARNHEDLGMSDKAKAESNAAENASSDHLPAIPETPVKRMQRKD